MSPGRLLACTHVAQVEQSLATAFRELATDYLDSLVLHSPMRTYADTMTVWRRFEAAVDEGKVRQIGISNCYDSQTLQRLVDDARIKPAVLCALT
jgi:diketogulonate reductase-like aldo/keto reductase